MVRNPELFFSLLALGLILAGLFYLIIEYGWFWRGEEK